MERIISNLLDRFEKGLLTRRELAQGFTMMAATGNATHMAHAQETGIKAVKIDHVSIQVSDLLRSIAFYQKMFGLTIVSEDKPNEIVRLGADKVLVSLHHKSPTGLVDHFAIGVEKFNREAVTRELKIAYGFSAVDPQPHAAPGSRRVFSTIQQVQGSVRVPL